MLSAFFTEYLLNKNSNKGGKCNEQGRHYFVGSCGFAG